MFCCPSLCLCHQDFYNRIAQQSDELKVLLKKAEKSGPRQQAQPVPSSPTHVTERHTRTVAFQVLSSYHLCSPIEPLVRLNVQNVSFSATIFVPFYVLLFQYATSL